MISSCNNKAAVIKNNNISIENFNMSQYSFSGKKIYTLKSPKTLINQSKQLYSLTKTTIEFFENKKLKYIINSDSAKLINNKRITLSGNVLITDIDNDNTLINANEFYWDLNNEKFILDGNVTLNNKYINLNSSKAYLDKNINIIEFSNPVKYIYKNNNQQQYKITSNNAFYNLNNKNIIFKSVNNKVKSIINF